MAGPINRREGEGEMLPNSYPMLDFDLGPEIEMLRDTTRSFAAAEIAPLASEIDRTDEFPRQLWPKMGELGLHGITVEEEYGGLGVGSLPHVVAPGGGGGASPPLGVRDGAH